MFYVDFIVKFKDGKIGLFDTKSGITAKDAKEKAEALQKYIKEQNKKGKQIIGGIIIAKGNVLYINDKEKYEYKKDDYSNLRVLDI